MLEEKKAESPELVERLGGRERRRSGAIGEREIGGEKEGPETVVVGEAAKASGGDGEAAEVFVGETAGLDTDFENSPP